MNAKYKLDKAIKRAITSEGILNMADTQNKVEQAKKKVEDANQKVADSRQGNVVSTISAFGTPSTHEDPYDERGKAIAQLPEEGDAPKQDERYDQDQESIAKAQEEAADEEVKAAEEAVASAKAQ